LLTSEIDLKLKDCKVSPIKRPLSRGKSYPEARKFIFSLNSQHWLPASPPLPKFLSGFGSSLHCTSHPSGSRS
jgi:hypothetical protein